MIEDMSTSDVDDEKPRRRIKEGDESSETVKIQNDEMVIPKTIGFFGGASFIVGSIIGAGIFISPCGVAIYSGSVGMTLLVWLLCGVMALLGALCYAELGTLVQSSGGDYSYLHHAYGPLLSFQYSWFNNVLLKPGSQATMALTFAEYSLTPIFIDCGYHPPEIAKKILAVILLLFLGAVNIISVKLANKVQIVFTVTKLTALCFIIGGGFYQLFQGNTKNLTTGFGGTNLNAGALMNSFYSGVWTYDGWSTANFMVEEMVNVERNLPLAIIIGVPIVIVVYVMTNVSYFTVLGMKEMTQSRVVALSWADKLFPGYGWVISIFVALSCFGTCNGSLFSGGRLTNAAARNNHLPSIFSMVHVRKYTPVTAIICNVAGAILITFVGSISELIDSLSFVMLMFYCFTFASVIVFRYKRKYKDLPRPIKVPLILPIICFLFTLCLVIIPLVLIPQVGYYIALAIIPIGYIFYFAFVYYRVKIPLMDKFTEFCQKLFQVCKPL